MSRAEPSVSQGSSARAVGEQGRGPADRLERLAAALRHHAHGVPLMRRCGHVTEVAASHIRVSGIERHVDLGAMVEIELGHQRWVGEVIGVETQATTVKLYSASHRLGLGAAVWIREDFSIRPDAGWRGRVLNALGDPIDGRGPLAAGSAVYAIDRDPLPPMALNRVQRPIRTGVRAIDLFTPICAGQRIGIFAGSGVGKSTLVSMLSRAPGFDTIVVALVAERGREVREFIEDTIGPLLGRAVVVVASSAESAMMRKMSAKTAMTIAEYFRDQGDEVLLVVDSITRFAHALREVALAAGEPPVARGYAPSVFAELPRLLERAGPGTAQTGSITGLFSVLVDGEDHNEPVADTVRGILDGHVILDRSIADQGRYPAINPLSSISRLAHLAWSKEEAGLVQRLRAVIARFEETRDLRSIGAYKPGADRELDQAVLLAPVLYDLLVQSRDDAPSAGVFDELAATLSQLRDKTSARATDAGQIEQSDIA